MKVIFFVMACVVLAVVPPIFIWNRVYKDGVIGRLALSGISLSSFFFLLGYVEEGERNPPATAVLLISSVALFLVWHLWRFHSRVLRTQKPTHCPPNCPEDRRRVPDRRFVSS